MKKKLSESIKGKFAQAQHHSKEGSFIEARKILQELVHLEPNSSALRAAYAGTLCAKAAFLSGSQTHPANCRSSR